MPVYVELFGIPRQRAGQAVVELELSQDAISLGEVILRLAKMYPDLAEECFQGERLQPGYVASLGGHRFVSAPETALQSGESLLILSADSGG